MKKLVIYSLIFFHSIGSVFAQLTIEECYSKARDNYPMIKRYELIEKLKDCDLSNAGKGYLPQISFSAKASYQSDVTKLPVDFSQLGISGVDVPALSKDQYGAVVDVSQTIWDGGAIKSRKENIRTSSEADEKSLEVALYAINDRVNQVFFGVLLFDAQIRQNKLYQEELQRNYEQISSRIENGIANRADLDAVKIEQLKSIQNESRLLHSKKAYCDVLATLIGEEISPGTELVKPDGLYPGLSVQRPELELYDTQIKNMEARHKEINAGLMPRLRVFVTGGYGKPGLNMLEDDFSAYYIAGVNLTWNFSNLYSNKSDKRKLQNNIASVRTQQETFLFNTNMDVSQKRNEIDMYRDQLKYDNEIIALRESVKQSSAVKMANGIISVTDLMRDVNAEELARQDKILHEMEMLLAIYNLKFTTNN